MKFARSLALSSLFSWLTAIGLVSFDRSALASCDPPPETPPKTQVRQSV
jgi:hypothetical protein